MKRFLFVCVENSCRSQLAEAFARIYGGDDVEAYSAGSRPSGIVNPKAIESMREIGYDLSKHKSNSLDELPDVKWDFVATMGCGDECPVSGLQRDDWPFPDPKGEPIIACARFATRSGAACRTSSASTNGTSAAEWT